jgi:hypothetical protein
MTTCGWNWSCNTTFVNLLLITIVVWQLLCQQNIASVVFAGSRSLSRHMRMQQLHPIFFQLKGSTPHDRRWIAICSWQSPNHTTVFNKSLIRCIWTKQHLSTDVTHWDERLKGTESALQQNGHPHSTLSWDNVECTHKISERSLRKSVHRVSLELGLSHSVVHNVFHKTKTACL